MKICALRHVVFEGPGLIAEWAAERGYPIHEVEAPTAAFPDPGEFDLVVVLGGSMAADDETTYPWLRAEKHFIAETIAAGRKVLGVCLGAQMLAEVIGGTVTRSPEPEVGWYPLALTEAAASDPVFSAIPDGLVAGHWHGDTFSVPEGATLMASSDACANQAFTMLGGTVIGVQFHLEWTRDSVFDMVERCAADLGAGQYAMDAAQVLEGIALHEDSCRAALWALLDAIEERAGYGDDA